MPVGRLKLVELLVVDRWVQAGVAERLQGSRAPVRNAVGPHRIGGHLRLLQSTVSTVLARFRVPLCGHIDVKMRPWFRAGVVYICCLSGMGGPSSFIRMHRERDYHQDQPTCPSLFGYRLDPFRSYIQMVFCEYTGAPVPAHHPHPPSDAWMRFLDRVYLLAPIPGWAFLWLMGGWDAVWWGGLLPWALIQNLFWASNYLVHTRGYVTYARPGHAEQGFNQRLLGAVSFGEGFHNNHHQFPGSARMGLGRWEIDLGYQAIRVLEAMRIVWDVRVASDQQA